MSERIDAHELKQLQERADKISGIDQLIRDLGCYRNLDDFGSTVRSALGRNLMHHAPRNDRLAANVLSGIIDGLIQDRNELAEAISDRVSLPEAPDNPYKPDAEV